MDTLVVVVVVVVARFVLLLLLSVDGVCWMLFCERIENINISLG